MNTTEFIEKALRKETNRTSVASVFAETKWTDNNQVIVYSYGYHYPLATIIDGVGFINNRGYSNTTSQHIQKAWRAITNIVGYENTYSLPLTNGDSLNLYGIHESAKREMERIIATMFVKKRKDTQVYAMLERDLEKIKEVVNVSRTMLAQEKVDA